MSRFLNILSFLSLLILTNPLGVMAQSSSYNPVTRWGYQGCYNETLFHEDAEGLRAVNDGIWESLPIMTVRMCITFCDSNGYIYAGMEYSEECYCGETLSGISEKINGTYCDLPCAGNSTETCGGHFKLSVFKRHKTSAASGLKPPGLVDGTKGTMGSMLALSVAVVVLFYLTW